MIGVANSNSIAYGAAKAFNEAGAEIMLTYGRPKTEQYVRPLLRELGNPRLCFAIYATRNNWKRFSSASARNGAS